MGVYCLHMPVEESGIKPRSSECSVLPGEPQDYFTIFVCFTVWPKIIRMFYLQPALYHYRNRLHLTLYFFTIS